MGTGIIVDNKDGAILFLKDTLIFSPLCGFLSTMAIRLSAG